MGLEEHVRAGVFIFLFLILHLYQMWYQMQFKELFMIEGLVTWCSVSGRDLLGTLVVIVYVLAFIALWFHLIHGFWSALHSVGWNNDKWMKRLKVVGNVISTVIVLGFIIVPIAMHLGYSNLLG